MVILLLTFIEKTEDWEYRFIKGSCYQTLGRVASAKPNAQIMTSITCQYYQK